MKVPNLFIILSNILKKNKPMSFKQLIINTNWQQADKLSDIFLELNALSVSIEDQFEGTDLEQEIFTEPELDNSNLWENSKVIILFNNEVDIESIIIKAKHLLGNDFNYTTELINNQNWVKLTQDQFNPIKITDNFYIVPSWHLSPNLNATSIILDPGLAFGTGSHPTTFMCLEWLSFNVDKLPASTVLDYGCGSGILAISAKKLGAKKVTGVDIDEQAILASNSNAKINDVNIEFKLPKKLPNKIKYDIVIANILANPLRILAPILADLTSKILLLSGILDTQSEELSRIYSQWFNVNEINSKDGWILLECTKNN